MCFLIVLVYAYSTPERFICVILFILGLWFVQARRNQRLDREQAERAAQRNPVEAPNILQSQVNLFITSIHIFTTRWNGLEYSLKFSLFIFFIKFFSFLFFYHILYYIFYKLYKFFYCSLKFW